jgi:hypothetical protein
MIVEIIIFTFVGYILVQTHHSNKAIGKMIEEDKEFCKLIKEIRNESISRK